MELGLTTSAMLMLSRVMRRRKFKEPTLKNKHQRFLLLFLPLSSASCSQITPSSTACKPFTKYIASKIYLRIKAATAVNLLMSSNVI